MRLTWKDALSSLLVAALGVTYALYLAWGSIGPSWIGIQDATGMAAVGLGIGVLVLTLGLDITSGASGSFRYISSGVRIVSAALGVLALLGENLFSATVWEGVLAAFMASIAIVFAMTVGRHARLFGQPQTHAPALGS